MAPLEAELGEQVEGYVERKCVLEGRAAHVDSGLGATGRPAMADLVAVIGEGPLSAIDPVPKLAQDARHFARPALGGQFAGDTCGCWTGLAAGQILSRGDSGAQSLSWAARLMINSKALEVPFAR